MVAPVLVFLALLMAYPLAQSFYISLTDKRVGTAGKLIGFRNYVALFSQGVFLQALKNSGIYVAVTVVCKTVLGMGLALLLERAKRAGSFLRAVTLLPWVIPISMSVLVWQWIFDPTFSVLNWYLTRMGLKAVPWLANATWARVSVITVNVWRGTPFFAIAMAAGLNAIPRELYETAAIDGAGEARKFFRITVPLLLPVLSIVLLYSVVMTVSDFEIVFVLTRGGPMQSTHLLGTLAYQIGLAGTEFGKGAAISLFILPVLFVSAVFALRTVTGEDRM